MNESQLEIVKKLIQKLEYLVDATINDAGDSYDEENEQVFHEDGEAIDSWDIKTPELADSYYKDIREAGDILTEAKKVFSIN